VSTIGEVEYECPFCGEKFNYITQFSYTIFSQNLDFKPFGAAIIPTPVPKCPKCGLVFFEELFTKDDINKLKQEFPDNNIIKLEPNMPNYYYLAREFELLDKEMDEIIYFYTSAIWEDNNFFEKIVNIIMTYFDKINNSNKNYYNYKLVKIDFLRRLKQFKMAQDLIELLKKDNNFPKNTFGKVLDYQLKLIEKEDIYEHEMPH